MKQGDVGVVLTFKIKDSRGKPFDLTGASNVTLVARLGNTFFEKQCVMVDPPKGVVKYIVQDGDLATAGTLSMELVVEYPDGRKFTSSRISDTVEGRLH